MLGSLNFLKLTWYAHFRSLQQYAQKKRDEKPKVLRLTKLYQMKLNFLYSQQSTLNIFKMVFIREVNKNRPSI